MLFAFNLVCCSLYLMLIFVYCHRMLLVMVATVKVRWAAVITMGASHREHDGKLPSCPAIPSSPSRRVLPVVSFPPVVTLPSCPSHRVLPTTATFVSNHRAHDRADTMAIVGNHRDHDGWTRRLPRSCPRCLTHDYGHDGLW